MVHAFRDSGDPSRDLKSSSFTVGKVKVEKKPRAAGYEIMSLIAPSSLDHPSHGAPILPPAIHSADNQAFILFAYVLVQCGFEIGSHWAVNISFAFHSPPGLRVGKVGRAFHQLFFPTLCQHQCSPILYYAFTHSSDSDLLCAILPFYHLTFF